MVPLFVGLLLARLHSEFSMSFALQGIETLKEKICVCSSKQQNELPKYQKNPKIYTHNTEIHNDATTNSDLCRPDFLTHKSCYAFLSHIPTLVIIGHIIIHKSS